MALKKKNVSDEVLTSDEKKIIKEDEIARIETSASFERMALANRLVSEKFGINEDYSVTKFNDKGKVVDITLEGSDFIVAVTIKNTETHGMYTQQ